MVVKGMGEIARWGFKREREEETGGGKVIKCENNGVRNGRFGSI